MFAFSRRQLVAGFGASCGAVLTPWHIIADKITVDGKRVLNYMLDTTQDPKTIDIAKLDPNNPNQVTRGIYKLEGNKLVVSLAKNGSKERPADFSAKRPAARRYEFERTDEK